MSINKYEILNNNYTPNEWVELDGRSKNHRASANRRAEELWSRAAAKAELERHKAEAAKAAAIAKRTAFLGAAAAIPLFPEIYAGWLVDYLKQGGVVHKTEQKFPFFDPWVSPTYEEKAIWMVTAPQTKATDVPVSDHRAPLKLFIGYGQDRFRSQFAMMTTDEASMATAPRQGRRRHVRSFEITATPHKKAADIFGQTAVFMTATLVPTVSGQEQFAPAYTNQPAAAYLYSDIDEIIRNLMASDRAMQHRLDQIDVYGSSRAITQ